MRVIRNLTDDLWMEVAVKSAEATFFHTPYWHGLVARTYPDYRNATVGAVLSNGDRVVLPMLETGRSAKRLLRHLVSSFGGCYGGVIAEGPLPAPQRQDVYATLVGRNVASLELVESPLNGHSEMPPRFESRAYSTHLLALEGGWAATQARFSRGHRASINRGKRMGVISRVASTLDEYREYYRLYEHSLERWGERASSRYPWLLFENGHHLSQSAPEHVKLWLAATPDRIVAGAWVFYWNQHVVYWHGATDTAFSSFRPSNVLHADIIQDACARGYRYYDFNPSGGHEGVARFKSGFGADIRPVLVWRYQSQSSEMLSSVRRWLP